MQVGKKREYKKQNHRRKVDPFYNSQLWKDLRDYIWLRDEALCQQCRREGRLMPLRRGYNEGHVDHIVPRNQGGTDDEINLELLCKYHHDAKSAKEKK